MKDRGDKVEVAPLHQGEGFPVPLDMQKHPQVIVFQDFTDAAEALHARGLLTDQQLDDVRHDR